MTSVGPVTPAQSTPPLNSIQILRAIAALGVMLTHIRLDAGLRLGAQNPLPDHFNGAAGVDLFFVISGFIMVYASESLFGRSGAPGTFLLRRVVRIVPLYWASTLVMIAYYLTIARHEVGVLTWKTVAASFLFFPFMRPDGAVAPIHMPGWTLNFEMFFYLFFASVLLLSRNLAITAITVLFSTMVLYQHFFGPLLQPYRFWCDPIILEFCFGMLIALAYRKGWRIPRLICFGMIVAGFSVVIGSPDLSGAMRMALWGIPAAAIVAGTALIQAPRGPGMLARLFVFLGNASYSIYLVHAISVLAVLNVFGRFNLGILHWPWCYILVQAAIALGASIAVYLLFERPVTRALQRRLRSRRSANTPLSVNSL